MNFQIFLKHSSMISLMQKNLERYLINLSNNEYFAIQILCEKECCRTKHLLYIILEFSMISHNLFI